MKDAIVVKRYADAYVDFAKATIGIPKAIAEVKHLKSLLREVPELLEFLVSLSIGYRDKSSFLTQVFEGKLSGELQAFLKLLLRKRRIEKIIEICDYIRVTYSRLEAVNALLKTSYPLDLELIRKIKEKLEERFQRKLNLYLELDGTLLGGIQVIIGNTVIDGSVRRRIGELKEKLMAVRLA